MTTDELAAALPEKPRALLWLQIAFVLALVGPSILLCFVGYSMYTETMEAARGRLARLAQIAEEQSQRVLETNEVISRGIETRIGSRSNADLMKDRDDLYRVVRAWSANLPQLQSVWVWDEAGHAVVTNLRPDPPSTIDVSDREYFIWARSTNADGWFVSAPLRSRLTGETFFDYSKRRVSATGAFMGVISV
ncbi:MAG: hypothetical protein M3N26_07115, partial [Pseudomonadota bacterium]|nr:hypothetical protein [Pseudomonadota bacterium]